METETTWIDEHRASCDVCEAFEVGYSRGKVALEFELLHWDGSHPPDDGCRPCVIARHLVRTSQRGRMPREATRA